MTYQQQVLVVPPTKPPSVRNTLASASVVLVLSIFLAVISYGEANFPSNAPVEIILATAAVIGFSAFGVVFAILDIILEVSRLRFKEVVTRYSAVTGDTRYNPYIIQPRIRLVVSLYITSVLIIVLAPGVFNLLGGGY